MNKVKFLSGVSAVIMTVAIVFSGVPTTALAADNSKGFSNSIEWKDSIESMLEERAYVEGEVIAIVDNTYKKQLTSVEPSEDVEKLADVSQQAVEETFETELDVPAKKSEKAAGIKHITSDTKTTRELLYELADDPSVLFAEPNYISLQEDWDEVDLEESQIAQSQVTENDVEEHAIEELNDSGDGDGPLGGPLGENPGSQVKKVLFTGTSADLIQTQGYEQVGDLSYLQWGYGSRTDELFTINSPNWNTKSGTNVNGLKTTNGTAPVGSQPVVAVIDSGIDYKHPDFDGLIEDMTKYSKLGGRYGYNASPDGMAEDDITDINGHGSHCAGIIASKWDGIGTSGVASGVKLCIVKTSYNGQFNDDAVIKAFVYLSEAVDNGLNLLSINCSYGGEGFSNLQLLMINELGQKGVITCVASGNSSNDNDDYPNTSADYSPSPYVIGVNSSVAAYMPSDFTCYGQTTTDEFSPGDAILSTVCDVSKTYVPMVDKERNFFESFNDGNSDVIFSFVGFYDMSNEETTHVDLGNEDTFAEFIDDASSDIVGKIVNDDSFDKDGYSYQIDVPALDSRSKRAVYIASVPANVDTDGNISESTHYAMALKSSLGRAVTWVKLIKFNHEDKISISLEETAGWQRPSKVWTNIPEAPEISTAESEYRPAPYYKNRLYFLIIVQDYDGTNEASQLNIDCVGSGNSTLRYSFYQGTSMATPAITGATAIMYDKLSTEGKLDGLTPAERARFVANTMKASVVYKDAYSGYCTSNGAFDFTVEEEEYTPVINTVTQSDKTLVIEGQYFGSEKGSVDIDADVCTVNSWSDKKVVLTLPDSVQNERHSLYLTATNGNSTTRKIIINKIKGSKRELFETQVELPEELQDCVFNAMTGIDGVLYVTPQTINRTVGKAPALVNEELWSYDPKTDIWTKHENIPLDPKGYDTEKRQRTTLTNYQGLIVAHSSYTVQSGSWGESAYKDEICFYNPAKKTWTKADISKTGLLTNGSIFATDKGVFFFDQPDPTEPEGRISKLNFDIDTVKSGASSVTITSATDAGISKKAYSESLTSGYRDNQAIIFTQQIEWLKWDDSTQKFTSEGLLTCQDVIGTKDGPVGFINTSTAALTPKGVLVTAFDGDEYTKRGYDSFFIDKDGNRTPFEKNAAFGDLYAALATYTGGYLYVWGDSYFNNDETIGYLVYTKFEDPVNPKTGDNTGYIWILFLAAVITLTGAVVMFRGKKRKQQ